MLSLAGLLAICGVALGQPRLPCPDGFDYPSLVADYLDPDSRVQARIRGIEGNHLNSNVENLIRGQSTAAVGGDLRFILYYVPNHHRAMQAMMRLALRERTEMPAESGPLTVRCWFERAISFNPKDGQAHLISGIYLARLSEMQSARDRLEEADRLLGDNVNVNYNLGLVYFELKDYERSLDRAKRAYAAGYPLPGLRQKLEQAGQWRD